MVLSLGIFPAVIGILKKFNKIDPYPSATKSQFSPASNSAPPGNDLTQKAVDSVASSMKPSSSSSSESSVVEDASSKEAAETRPSRSESSLLPETQAPVPEESVADTRQPSRSSSSESSEAAPVERNRDTQEAQAAYIAIQMLKWNDAKGDEKHIVLKEIITDPESSKDWLGLLLKNLKIPQEMLLVSYNSIRKFSKAKKYLPTETAALLMEKGIDIFDGLEVQKDQLATKEDLTVKFAMTWNPEDPVNSESIFWLKMMIKNANTGSVQVDPKAFILAILNLSWIPKETVEHPDIREALSEYHLDAKSIVSGSTGNFFYGFIRKAIDVAYGKISPDKRSKEYELYSKQFRLVELELHLHLAGLSIKLSSRYDSPSAPIKDNESLNHYLEKHFLGHFNACFSEEHIRNYDLGMNKNFHKPKNFNRYLFFLEVLSELLKDNPGLESSLNLGRILEVRFYEQFKPEFERNFKENSKSKHRKSPTEILGNVFLVFELSYAQIQSQQFQNDKEYLKALGNLFKCKLNQHKRLPESLRSSEVPTYGLPTYLEWEDAIVAKDFWENSFENFAEQHYCTQAAAYDNRSLVSDVHCSLPPKTAAVQTFENAEVDHTLKGH